MKKIRPLEEKINNVVTDNGVILVEPKFAQEEMISKLNNDRTIVSEQGMITVKPPADNDQVYKEDAKKVLTLDSNKETNGYLLELFKDGNKTISYLTTVAPGKFKGYHLHKIREANYICLKGKVKIILYTANGREEHILSADKPERLHIPTNIPTGLSNEWKTEAWIVNFPNPAYNPELKNEQVEYTEEQCKEKLRKDGTYINLQWK